MKRVDLSVIILTGNEQQHIERCIASVRDIAARIYVVDCFSTDQTREIATGLGAEVYQNRWVNYATQFNWALENLPLTTEWIFRLDADEVVTDDLKQELQERLPTLPNEVSGIYVKRRMMFLGKWISHGAMHPAYMLRIWRRGSGFCEKRWMDEHIKLIRGESIAFQHDIIDDNLNNLTWWIAKHNDYATREAVDLLNIRYDLIAYDEVTPTLWGTQVQRKRWLKLRYARLPLFVRPVLYFIYRYFFRLGFMDGREGLAYHFLQGFWYRFLVDAKLFDLHRKCGNDRVKIVAQLKDDYGIDI